MTTNEIRRLGKEYIKLSDKELAREFVQHDKIILELWNDTDNDTMDEHTVLQDIITERFIAQCKIGLVWNDNAQNWVAPGWHKVGQDKEHKKIDYWVPEVR